MAPALHATRNGPTESDLKSCGLLKYLDWVTPKNITLPIPRLMGVELAAGYFGISERSFERQLLNAAFPQPIKIGRRSLWDRKVLDIFIDELSGLAPLEPETDADW